ncbi:MAG: D-Ala-D-Ala carboxypeptidase family metallohydrolase [Acidobacteria bacterium]|nr:D-Ala-D-Ala carboxypeptidase family metallohydrolase [Acidobacteriota bacterium]
MPWGIVSSDVWWNLDIMRSITYGKEITVTCGYRCPVRNAAIVGAVAGSYHQFGRGVDLYPEVRNDYGEFMLLRYAACVSWPVELLDWDTYPADHHLHVAW